MRINKSMSKMIGKTHKRHSEGAYLLLYFLRINENVLRQASVHVYYLYENVQIVTHCLIDISMFEFTMV